MVTNLARRRKKKRKKHKKLGSEACSAKAAPKTTHRKAHGHAHKRRKPTHGRSKKAHETAPVCAPKKHKHKHKHKKRKPAHTEPVRKPVARTTPRVAKPLAVPAGPRAIPTAPPVPPPVGSSPMQPPKPGGGTTDPINVPPPPPAPKNPLPPGGVVPSPLTKHSGTFTAQHAERLLWRAAFGPAPGQAAQLAAKGLDAAVLSITRPQGDIVLTGPGPTGAKGRALQPGVIAGDDEAYWLDRMIRTSHPLIERMALTFHDWFANDADIVQHWDLSFAQTNVFRANALGSFHQLLLDITQDPSMILFLDLNLNSKDAVNENYARELMELFTLGADRGAYTEQDVRQVARALTGFYTHWTAKAGFSTDSFRFEPSLHDTGLKTIFGQTGNYDWRDVCRLIVQHPLHASFFVKKLWSYFIPVDPSTDELNALCQLYVSSGYEILPVVEAILTSETFYASPRMVKPPVVYLAGLLRARRRYIDDDGWYQYTAWAGQRLYFPPDVAGWDENLWLNPDTMRGRWVMAARVVTGSTVPSAQWAAYPLETAEKAVADALTFWSYDSITPESRDLLLRFATSCDPTGTSHGNDARRVNALRILVPSLPDYQTC